MRNTIGPSRLLCASGALACALLTVAVAPAAGVAPGDANPAQKKSAMEHFTAGKKASESKDWDKAVGELRASLDVVDSPNVRLALARALRDSGKLADAWGEYGRTIEGATKLAAKEERYAQTADAATSERAEVEQKIAFVIPSVAHAGPDTKLSIAGKDVPSDGWGMPVVVPPGNVDLVVTSGGKEVARKSVKVGPGEKSPVTVDAQAAGAPAAPAASSAAPDNDDNNPPSAATASASVDLGPPSDNTKLRPYAYVAGGVGAAGLLTFTIFGLMSNSAYSDLQSACTGTPPRCPPDKADEINSGKTQQTIANIGLGVGVLGLAAGATLFFMSQPSGDSAAPPPAPAAALVVGPGYVGVRGSL